LKWESAEVVSIDRGAGRERARRHAEMLKKMRERVRTGVPGAGGQQR
jgi:hypothetical protein